MKGRDLMPDGFDKLAGAIGDTLKTAPTLYEDALQPTVQEVGKFAARIPRAINAAFSGLDKWILNKEYAIDETKKLLEKKLENVDPDKIVEPEVYVAVPAIQAISYSMNSEELRNLYANLLAKAMNSDTKDMVHPSFVEIIKQMSPIDSLLFKTIMERPANPIINLVYSKFEPDIPIAIESSTIITNVTDINVASVETVCISIDNLIKQGLISIPKDDSYVDATLYDNILKSQYYAIQQQNHPDTPNGLKFSHEKKMIVRTNLGKSFYQTLVTDSL